MESPGCYLSVTCVPVCPLRWVRAATGESFPGAAVRPRHTSVPAPDDPCAAHPWWRHGRRFVDETRTLMPFCDRPETLVTDFPGLSKADTHEHFSNVRRGER